MNQARLVSLSIEQVNVEQLPTESTHPATIGKLGALSFIYDTRLSINLQNQNFIDFNTGLNHAVLGANGYKTVDDYFPIKLYYNRNGNPDNLSPENYFKTHGPLNDKKAPPPDSAVYTKVNNIDAYKVTYHTSSLYFHSYYYDFVIYYIINGTDEYEIWGYELPDKPSNDLTTQDITDAKSYKKSFDDLVGSMHF